MKYGKLNLNIILNILWFILFLSLEIIVLILNFTLHNHQVEAHKFEY